MDNKMVIEHILAVKQDVAAIKVDVAYHIRRTDLLEDELKKIQKDRYMMYGIFAFLLFLASMSKIAELFLHR